MGRRPRPRFILLPALPILALPDDRIRAWRTLVAVFTPVPSKGHFNPLLRSYMPLPYIRMIYASLFHNIVAEPTI